MKTLLAVILCLCYAAVGWTACTQTQLNTEFFTDPTQRTYASCAGTGGLAGTNVNDQCVLDKFNALCNNAACRTDRVITRDQLYGAMNSNELSAIVAQATTLQYRLLQFVFTINTFDMSDTDIRAKLTNVFPATANPPDFPVAAPTTRNNIGTLQKMDNTRAFNVCGRQGTLSDVSLGLRGNP